MTGEVRCPKCGRRTAIRTAREDDRKYYVCINYPRCKGSVPVDEVWGDDWGEEKSATKTTNDRSRQRREPSSPKSGAGTVIRKPGKDKRESEAELKRPQRKGEVLIDEVWGDDWGKEIPASNAAPYRPQHPRAQKRAVVPEEKKPARPPQQRVLKVEVAPEKKKPSEPLKQITPRQEATPEVKAPPKLRQRRVPQQYLVPEKKKQSTVLIIIAIVIAFLAIDGMIYAAFVLR